MGSLQFARIHRRFGSTDTAVALDSTHDPTLVITDQPIAGRHRTTGVKDWRVAQHDRVAILVANDDLECSPRLAAE
jgi:hypothetical protein